MAIGSTENMASALNAVKQIRSQLSTRQKLLLLLFADEACGGGAVVNLAKHARICKADSSEEIYDDLRSMSERGYLSISAVDGEECFCAFGIATAREVDDAIRHSGRQWRIECGPAVDGDEAQSRYIADRWNASGAGDRTLLEAGRGFGDLAKRGAATSNQDDETTKFVVENLASIEPFLSVARMYGFALTATPKGVQLLGNSHDEKAARLLCNICPVERSPWAKTTEIRPTRFSLRKRLAILFGKTPGHNCVSLRRERISSGDTDGFRYCEVRSNEGSMDMESVEGGNHV